MKKLLIAGVAAVSLAAPFVGGSAVHVAEARPDCQAVDYNGDGIVDISDIVAAMSLPGAQGRVQILLDHFGQAC